MERTTAATDARPHESRTERKRREIMQAAATVFLRNGYLGSSTDEIAALAGVSKQTLYRHFADKERLFAEIIRATASGVDDLVQTVTRTLEDTGDLERDLGVLARRFLSSIMRPEVLQLRRLVIGEAGRFPELGRAYWEEGFERVLATLASCLERLDARGLLRVPDPPLAANHFAGLLLWIPVNQVMFTGLPESFSAADLDRLADAGVAAFLAAYGRP